MAIFIQTGLCEDSNAVYQLCVTVAIIGYGKSVYVIVRNGSEQRKVVVNLRLSEQGYCLSTRSRRRLQSKFLPTVACPLHSCIMKWGPSQNSQT